MQAQTSEAPSNVTEPSLPELLATTVHDVMSPLTYIKGTAQRLRNLEDGIADGPARAELRTRLDGIDSAASRIASALTALLHASGPQLDEPRQRAFKPTNLVSLTRRAVAEQQQLARHHAIRLVVTHDGLSGTWNECLLDRMLANLIGNAVKYSPQGSVVDVDLSCEEDAEGNCWAVLRITDHGCGIPSRDLPFVFEPYQRGSNVAGIGGTGLGLASVWQTIRTHEGRLWVDSVEGKGTCVTVRLPANSFERPPLPLAA
jgi:signal transduction histidine kinase